MARLIPAIGSSRMTRGELRVAERLEDKLDDDYLIWFNVPVGERPRYPDFLVLHAQRGLLALEVKDWKIENFLPGCNRREVRLDFGSGPAVRTNPFQQSRDSILALVRKLETDARLLHPPGHAQVGRLKPAWGFGVVLPYITRAQFLAAELEHIIPEGNVLCRDDLYDAVEAETLQSQLWSMFMVRQRQPLTLPDVDRLRWHIFPEIRIDAPAVQMSLNMDEVVPDLIRVMDIRQEELARSMGEGHRVVHGVAGSGKTMLLIYRCLHLARLMERPILVLCYNKAVAERLRHQLELRGAGGHVSVFHFHAWCREQLRCYLGAVPQQAPEQSADDFFAELVSEVRRGIERGLIPTAQYSALLIDEGHDFEEEWLRIAVQMVDPETNSLLLLYDDAQAIYRERRQQKFSFAQVGVQARGRTTIMRLNYRNTVQVLRLASRFASDILTPEIADEDGVPCLAPETAGRHGAAPLLRRFDSAAKEADFIVQRIQEFLEAGLALEDIAIISRHRWAQERVCKALAQAGIAHRASAFSPKGMLDFSHASVKLLTMHASKGLEFPVVFLNEICGLPYKNQSPIEEARLMYVAMTRATEHLILTHHGESEFTRRMQQII